jgi:hypothetical protein
LVLISGVAAKMHTPVKGQSDSHREKFVIDDSRRPITPEYLTSLVKTHLAVDSFASISDMVPRSEPPCSRRLKRSSCLRTSARRVCPPLDRSFLIDTRVHLGDINERYFRATSAYMCHSNNEFFVSYVLSKLPRPHLSSLAPLARLVSSHGPMRNRVANKSAWLKRWLSAEKRSQ